MNKNTLIQILWIVGIGSFLTILAPFGAARGLHPFFAWLYWTGFVSYGAIAAYFIVPTLQKRLGHLPILGLYFVISLVIAIAVSVGILAMTALLGDRVPIQSWPQLYLYVWVVSVAITTIMALREQASRNHAQAIEPKFNKRIPANLAGGTLYSVSAEDHYLRIRTSRGDALILMRLGDALEELADMDGLQTHRSWWVAREGVDKIQRQNGKITLILRDGTKAPVSRTYAPVMRRAGWFS